MRSEKVIHKTIDRYGAPVSEAEAKASNIHSSNSPRPFFARRDRHCRLSSEGKVWSWELEQQIE